MKTQKKLAKKCEQWRLEADKQNENAKRYREERNKCKFSKSVIIFVIKKLDRDQYDKFRSGRSGSSSDRNRLEENEGGLDMIRQAYKEATSRDSCRSDKSVRSDSSKHSNRSHKRY